MGMRATGGINETVCFYGYAIDILKAVEEKLHFVGEVQISSDGKYGTYQADTERQIRELLMALSETFSMARQNWALI